MENIFCYRHLWPTGNGLAALGDFHFRDLEMTLQRSSKVKVIADSESPFKRYRQLQLYVI